MNNATIELAKKLVACPSVTPNDAGCQDILAAELKAIGFNITFMPFGETRNMWATFGSGSPHFMFAGHTDVVPPGDLSLWDSDPFTPTIRDHKFFGRGIADMKGGIAAMVIAVKTYLQGNPQHKGTISFLITSDEEGPALDGTIKVVEQLIKDNIKVDYCIVGEPSSQQCLGDTIKLGSRGSLSGAVTFHGKQGHVGYPHRANNPIHHTMHALDKLAKLNWDQPKDGFPASCLQITNVKAGVGAENVIPATLECHFNIRFNPQTTADQIKASVDQTFKLQELPYKIDWRQGGKPFSSKQGKLTEITQTVVREITGNTCEIANVGGTSDARFIVNLGCEVFQLGLTSGSIHAINEHVPVEELDKLREIYQVILTEIFSG